MSKDIGIFFVLIVAAFVAVFNAYAAYKQLKEVKRIEAEKMAQEAGFFAAAFANNFKEPVTEDAEYELVEPKMIENGNDN